MKKSIILTLSVFLFSVIAIAQSNLPAVDKSPMDMVYYPSGYPVLKIQDKAKDPLIARLIYSRPKREGRTVFGGLVTYGKVWRLGANEATEIEFYRPVTIGGKKVLPGRYTLYAMVNEKSWTFIINKETDTWGAFKYDAAKDVARAEVPVDTTSDNIEALSMIFNKSGTNFSLVVAWENVKVSLPISL